MDPARSGRSRRTDRRSDGHGELEREAACFLRIEPTGRAHTYGLGMSLLTLMRHPLDAAGSVLLPAGPG